MLSRGLENVRRGDLFLIWVCCPKAESLQVESAAADSDEIPVKTGIQYPRDFNGLLDARFRA